MNDCETKRLMDFIDQKVVIDSKHDDGVLGMCVNLLQSYVSSMLFMHDHASEVFHEMIDEDPNHRHFFSNGVNILNGFFEEDGQDVKIDLPICISEDDQNKMNDGDIMLSPLQVDYIDEVITSFDESLNDDGELKRSDPKKYECELTTFADKFNKNK